jgi:lipopolysaccharide export system protein LptC
MAPRRAHGVGRLARRGLAVRVAKYALPVAALALLSSIALWPEFSRTLENGRVTWRHLTMVQAGTGTLLRPRYRGMDEHDQPYVISADTAQQMGPERVNLKAPRGDVTMRSACQSAGSFRRRDAVPAGRHHAECRYGHPGHEKRRGGQR